MRSGVRRGRVWGCGGPRVWIRVPPPGAVRVPARPAGGALRQGGGRARAGAPGDLGRRAPTLGLNDSAIVIICNHRA